jgi:hypothetical protein
MPGRPRLLKIELGQRLGTRVVVKEDGYIRNHRAVIARCDCGSEKRTSVYRIERCPDCRGTGVARVIEPPEIEPVEEELPKSARELRKRLDDIDKSIAANRIVTLHITEWAVWFRSRGAINR